MLEEKENEKNRVEVAERMKRKTSKKKKRKIYDKGEREIICGKKKKVNLMERKFI